MTLRKKTLWMVGTTLIGLLILLPTISSTILLQGFVKLEKLEVEKNIIRLNNIFASEMERLFIIAGDYAAWDDTYDYMHTHDEEYITANMVDSTFENFNLNLIMILDLNGQVVFEKHRHGKKFDVKPFQFYKHIDLIIKDTPKLRGLLLLPDEIMLLATHPIITSEEEGPSRGTLIMGYFLNETEIDRISNLAQLSITVQRFDQSIPSDINQHIQVIDKHNIIGFTTINDIYKQPAILLKLTMLRSIFQQGLNSLRYVSIFVLGFAIISAGLILWLFERLVLSRLAFLSEEIENISINNKLTVQGDDELDQLAMTINKMLTELQKSNEKTLSLLDDNQFLVSRSIAIQEDERRELSRELHDEFGQCLIAIQADATNIVELTKDSDIEFKNKIIPSANAVIDTSGHIYSIVHSLMQQLRPSSLDELGLTEALQELITKWQMRHKVNCILMIEADGLNLLGNNINIMIYRIIQESLTNIAKHAQATKVIITLNIVAQKLMINIHDNGCGMDINNHKRGLGLIGIRERVRSLDGTINLNSDIGKGVKIALTIPIADEFLSKHQKWN
ncbi:MAG TPA: HAMP domain-containing protein [Thioploca sp.]|nr:HAMP domain-containing protein [Thioploca sp.]